MGAVPHITDGQIEAALYKNFGNVTMAALELGCNPRTIRYRINGDDRAKFAACRFESKELLLDISEAGMAKHLLAESESMIRFHLTQQGRARGFGNRTELTGEGGGPVVVAAQPVVELDSMPDEERELLRELLRRQRARQLGSAEGL